MAQFGYNELKPSQARCDYAAEATNIITVGVPTIAAITYVNGAAINALPEDTWTDLQDINLGAPFLFSILAQPTYVCHAYVELGAETVGDYLRLQWELDGDAIMDITVGPSKVQMVYLPIVGVAPSSSNRSIPQFANSRFRTRAYKHGTIDAVASIAGLGAIHYLPVRLSN
jgi:hypothetical protein